MSLSDLAFPRQDYSYAFLDDFAKRELRRRLLKAVALPGYQVPYASREMPMARGWGTGGLQVTLSIVGPRDVVKVIDQGDDASVNAANLRGFIARMAGVETTNDALAATIIQSRHRVPEERLGERQILVLQVPDPEPLRQVQPSLSQAREMHAEADYAQMWLGLYEQLVHYQEYTGGSSYPVVVHGRYVMSPSPIPRWDNPKLHQAAHLTLLSAGREKRLYAVPPYTDVYPIEFDDVPFRVEEQAGHVCVRTGGAQKFMTEIPQADGDALWEISDTGYAAKLNQRARGEAVTIGETYYDDKGDFYPIPATSNGALISREPPRLVASQPLLVARGLVKRYGSVVAVDGVDLDVYPGEVMGIVGESGSGKSTVLRLLNLEEPADRGSYYLDVAEHAGVDLFTLDRVQRREVRINRIGIVYQYPHLGLRMKTTSGGNVAERLILAGERSFATLREAAKSSLAVSEFPLSRLDDVPARLSGGMQQRVQLAKAIALRPAVLLLDEPTHGLDVSIQALVLDTLKRLQRELRVATVLVSHDLGVIRTLADRVLVMRDGKVVERGLTDQVLEDPQHAYTQQLVHAKL